MATAAHLHRFQLQNKAWHLGINHSHMNFNNKTNFGGVLKLSDHKLDKWGGVVPANKIRATLKKMAKPRFIDGDAVYLEFLNKMVGITWVKCRKPVDLVHDLSWVMLFCLLWEEGIVQCKEDKAGYKMDMKSGHCLTSQTLEDRQIYCQEMLLGMERQKKHNPGVAFIPDRRSSRFSEYFFGDMRMAIRGQMKFSSKSALRLMQIALTKYSAESMSDIVAVSLRRYKHNDAELKMYNGIPEDYWRFDMVEEMNVGCERCLKELKDLHFNTMKCTVGTVKDLKSLKDRDARWKAIAKKCGEAIEKEAVVDNLFDDEDEDEVFGDGTTAGRPRGFIDEGGGGESRFRADCEIEADEGEWEDRDKQPAGTFTR